MWWDLICFYFVSDGDGDEGCQWHRRQRNSKACTSWHDGHQLDPG
jgi:hypothetical protein